MLKRDEELITIALGDAQPSQQMKRWLSAGEGRRELESYRRTLEVLNTLYADVPVVESKRVVYYTSMRTPVGRVWVAATEAGLVRVSFDRSEAAFAADLREQLRMDAVKSAEKMAGVVSQLEAYFAGKRRAFDVPVDLSRVAPFQRAVLMAARTVPAGQVVSYGEIARRIGRPGASRAVGQALGRNPAPIVIPCHRVVTSAGGLGGYIGGLSIKRKLLALEGAYRGS
jgi:methylated-DNA-[protein]-cysteine S-methyltransferase